MTMQQKTRLTAAYTVRAVGPVCFSFRLSFSAVFVSRLTFCFFLATKSERSRLRDVLGS
jgi:hypothetical protein